MADITRTKRYKEWQTEYAAVYDVWAPLNSKVTALKKQAKALAAEADGNIETNDIKIATSASNRFDTTRFKADHPELYAQYMKTTNSVRVTRKIT